MQARVEIGAVKGVAKVLIQSSCIALTVQNMATSDLTQTIINVLQAASLSRQPDALKRTLMALAPRCLQASLSRF